jgi:exodeoxyribonuclease V beta subunit
MTPRLWQDDAELPEGVTWLLEASAGTGKTYQIAGLFVRLVAEYSLPVESILAITFTKAATAELRDRIRRRLSEALAALKDRCIASEDPVIERLRGLGAGAEMIGRLELALRSFDIAPISTIHGFSQRMLDEFAFDSGQDAKLELLQDSSEIIEQIVDDSLARLYAEATADDLGLLRNVGVTRDKLLRVAKAMSDAAEPRVVPKVHDEDLVAMLPAAKAWCERVAAMKERWASVGTGVTKSLTADVVRKQFNRWQERYIGQDQRELSKWLRDGGLADPTSLFKRLRSAKMRSDYKGNDLESGPYWSIALELDVFCDERARFILSFNPLAAFAAAVRRCIEAELERRRALTFSSMLSRLAERVEQDGGADSRIAKRIRERFQAVFVDEFQDTDLVQWKVIEAAFHGHRRLLLLGDPKQAIYGFRGADVHVYLRAARGVDESHQRTMASNWRSDPAAVTAMNQLWRAGSGAFDQDAIDYVEVQAKRPTRLKPSGAGLDLRWVDARTRDGDAGSGIGAKDLPLIAKLVAREAAAWLRNERGAITDGESSRRAVPGDLAVLVNDRYEAQAVRHALDRVGIRAITASKDSVFQTEVAGWLAHWLDAVAGAGQDRSSRTAVVMPLFGWTADELAWALEHARPDSQRSDSDKADARDFAAWTDRLRAASERWYRRGFAGTFDREAMELEVYERVLALPFGERHATDLRHLFELLHVEERSRRLGPAALAEWLRGQGSDSGPARGDDVVQRLESDANAVTIETIHASKGLEYPIVFLPFGWSAKSFSNGDGPLIIHGDNGVELNLERADGESRKSAFDRYVKEQRREDLRKLYVGLTRAEHRTVAWYGPIGSDGLKANATALGRLLMRSSNAVGYDEALPVFKEAKAAEKAKPANKRADPEPVDAWTIAQTRLNELVSRSGGAISWAAEAPIDQLDRVIPTDVDAEPDPRTTVWPAERKSISGPWRVTSFTGLSGSFDRNEKMSAEPIAEEDTRATDRTAAPIAPNKPASVAFFADLPRLSLGRGTEYGSWVHDVFEHLEFSTCEAKDGRKAVELIRSSAESVGMTSDDAMLTELERLLPKLITTPLGSDAPDQDSTRGLPVGFTLRDLARTDRLDELGFNLRLGSGTDWGRVASGDASDPALGCVDPSRVYDALFDHERLLGGHSSWLARLRKQREQGRHLIGEIVGILAGSIDLTFRVGAGNSARYFIVDYKTNRIETSKAVHYAQAWLAWEMTKANYTLQSLIYTIALHRHLRLRLRGYDYDEHMGGYLYLFLRGMSGAETPRDPASGRCLGVFGDRWPKALVLAFDDALSPSTSSSRSFNEPRL